jgi:hypothetical protein
MARYVTLPTENLEIAFNPDHVAEVERQHPGVTTTSIVMANGRLHTIVLGFEEVIARLQGGPPTKEELLALACGIAGSE